MRRAIIDVDGTLWDLHTPLNKLLSELYPGFPPDLPTSWNYFLDYITKEQFYAAVDIVHKSQSEHSPFLGAAYLFSVLTDKNLEIVVASHRAYNTAHTLVEWLNKHDLYPYSTVYTGPDKTRFIRKGDIVIDDAPKTISHAFVEGACVYYLSWPWNERMVGSTHVNLFDLTAAVLEDLT